MNEGQKNSNKNTLLALFFVGILAVMLVPLPPLLIDALLCANITLSLMILMAVLNAGRPVELCWKGGSIQFQSSGGVQRVELSSL